MLLKDECKHEDMLSMLETFQEYCPRFKTSSIHIDTVDESEQMEDTYEVRFIHTAIIVIT